MAYVIYENWVRGTYSQGQKAYRAGYTSKDRTSNNPYRSDKTEWWGENVSSTSAADRFGVKQELYNALYERVKSKCHGDTSQLLTAAAEWESSHRMIMNRAIYLRRAYLALRKGNFAEVSHHLAMPIYQRQRVNNRVRKTWRTSRPTEAWLEYWMGWAPMLSDIYNAVENICNPYPDQRIAVGVSRSYADQSSSGSPTASAYVFERWTTQITLGFYGKMRVTNHNLFLANQLGLLNPAQTAWEIVPFSFMADWVLNVGKVLGSLTDFAGLTLYDTGYGRYSRSTFSTSGFFKEYDSDRKEYVPKYFSGGAKLDVRTRDPGSITLPSLTMRFNPLSLTQSATAVSLLSEAFISGRKN